MRWAVAGGGTVALAAALWTRIHNARAYPADWGFDAHYNCEYILTLSRTWQLPRQPR